MTGTVPHLEDYIKSGFNVLLTGLHGIGKTYSIKEACEKLNLKMKYYSASSLDPFTDLVGVPVPAEDEHGVKFLQMVRPREIDEAEVVVFDELNRAESKTRNAVMELIQFRSINGEVLPNLKAVIAAVNPPDEEYDVESLDPAIIDRFHVVIEVKPTVSLPYFVAKFGPEKGKVLVTWHASQKQAKREAYISPRRLEIIGDVWEATKSLEAMRQAMPPGHVFEVRKLVDALREAEMTPEAKAKIKAAADAKAATKLAKEAARVQNVINWSEKELRSPANIPALASALTAAPTDEKLHRHVMSAYQSNFGVQRIFGEFLPVVKNVDLKELNNVMGTWTPTKLSQARSSAHRTFNDIMRKETKGKKAPARGKIKDAALKAKMKEEYANLGLALRQRGGVGNDPITSIIESYLA